MISDPVAWAALSMTIVIASLSGIYVASLARWSPVAVAAGIPVAVGVGLGPLVLGLLSVIALGVGARQSHVVHLAIVQAPLLVLAVLGARQIRHIAPRASSDARGWTGVLLAVLVLLVLAVVSMALVLPLTKNDPLEYAIVGRELFLSRDIADYPLLARESSPSGFFGPWTHPPLFPALIYTMFVLQGHTETTGLMRAIGPWATLASAFIIYAIARLSRNPHFCSTFAAALFLSTPLVFIGATSAAIDPLPMLGASLLLAVVVGIRGTPVHKGVVCGAVLGLALWTHSQAILYPVLSIVAVGLRTGWRNPRPLVVQLFTMAAVAAAVAAWPYARNLRIFNALISDSPAVFMLRELDWAQYFLTARGLDNWPDKIQYGVFKGWFELEMFSLAFWLMLAGLFFVARALMRSETLRLLAEGRLPIFLSVMVCAAGTVTCYLAGAIAAALIGQDLMIRNARYLLMLMPSVALLAAGGLAQLPLFAPGPALRRRLADRIRTLAAISLRLAVMALLAGQFVALVAYTWRPLRLTLADIRKPELEKLSSWRPNGAVAYLRHETPPDAVVLSLKPADMFYTGRKMVSYLDPRLLDFYRARDPVAAWSYLRSLGIRYVHVPDYFLPPLYNSQLLEILARPDLAALRHSSDGYQIYELIRTGDAVCSAGVRLEPAAATWEQQGQVGIVGWRPVVRFVRQRNELNPAEFTGANTGLPLFTREQIMTLRSPKLAFSADAGCALPCTPKGPREYRLEIELEGIGFVEGRVLQYDQRGNETAVDLVGEAFLSRAAGRRMIVRRFWAEPYSTDFRLTLEHRGSASVRIPRAVLQPVKPAACRPG